MGGGGNDEKSETTRSYERLRSERAEQRPTGTDYSIIGHNSPLGMSSDSLLPGQPVPLPRGPTLKLGSGIYTRNGETRASLFGTPLQQGSVRLPSLST